MVDFSKLMGSIEKEELPEHPIKIFGSLDALPTAPKNLWVGQAEVLEGWYKNCEKNDVLISLSTGAGKTIIGLLIAQSLVNQGHDNVVYVCSTIDLVYQTMKEAEEIGLEYTIRVGQEFNNILFQSGEGFCITTYQAIFNGHSRIRKSHFPRAIVFDDAHVAESMLRDAYTISIDSGVQGPLFNEIADLFSTHFEELGASGKFKDSIIRGHNVTAFVSPRGLQKNKKQLLQILNNHISTSQDLTYSFENIKDHIEACAAIFANGVFQLSPPFLPSLAMDIFDQPIKRVYLSATLQSKIEFIRAFGREPDKEVIASPDDTAGKGERLIIMGEEVSDGFSLEFVKGLSDINKVIIAVPNRYSAQKWSELAEPSAPDSFSQELDEFRELKKNGAFILVSRVDGIDLPDETCRLMVMDGLPAGTSLLERYQWEYLKMENVQASRIANRLAQLFGRINRGRNDYGVYLLEGRNLNAWLRRDRNIALLPPLLQKQILLGRAVQKKLEINTHENVMGSIISVLSRNKDWLNYYKSTIKLGDLDKKQAGRVEETKSKLEMAAISEAKYANYLWRKEYDKARMEIEKSSREVAVVDKLLSAWHSVWLGAVYDLEKDSISAERAYDIARQCFSMAISLPMKSKKSNISREEEQSNSFFKSLDNYLEFPESDKCKEEISKAEATLKGIRHKALDGAEDKASNEAEEAVRLLGEMLGFNSTRPDNDIGTGPDVLWVDNETNEVVAFELKTNKKPPISYRKRDIDQGRGHIAWVKGQKEGYKLMGLVYIAQEIGYASSKGTPSEEMHFIDIKTIYSIMEQVVALLNDLYPLTELERRPEMLLRSKEEKWKINSVFAKLIDKPKSV